MPGYFARQLLKWHELTPRPLPWDNGPRDAYHIWISEIIMQQTRIEQGTPYYLKFISRFPSVRSLANASADEVLRYWQGLGYYSRARNLHLAARKIMNEYGGAFPDTYEGLLSLPGIGPYSAAAIASFAYGLSYPVVDGNVKRVIARFSGIDASIDDSTGHAAVLAEATTCIRGTDPALFNQAIMNFGALVCKPKGALCTTCPLSKKCYAYQNELVEQLPVRSKTKTDTARYFHFFVIHYRHKILLIRRESKDIWRGLYTPPILETTSDRKPSTTSIRTFVQSQLGEVAFTTKESMPTVVQALSHQTIHGRFHHIHLSSPPLQLPPHGQWVTMKQFMDCGKPKMVAESLFTT